MVEEVESQAESTRHGGLMSTNIQSWSSPLYFKSWSNISFKGEEDAQSINSGEICVQFFFVCFFVCLFFTCCAHGMWKFQGQWLNQLHSSDPNHSNARSLTNQANRDLLCLLFLRMCQTSGNNLKCSLIFLRAPTINWDLRSILVFSFLIRV